jgi:hypothetical protein
VPAEGTAKLHHGRFIDTACIAISEAETGEYEWTPGAARAKFTAAIGATALETVHKTKITCSSATGTGEYTNSKTESLTLVFSGCQRAAGESCRSEAAAAGEIRSHALTGVLGFVSGQGTEAVVAGVALGPVGSDPYLATFECGGSLEAIGSQLLVSGGAIASFGGVDKMATTRTERFAAAAGVQKPRGFEGATPDVLSVAIAANPPEEAGLTAVETSTSEERLEVKALP